MQGHVELWFVGGWRPNQFALWVSWDDGAVCQGESVQRAESVAVPQHCTETDGQKNTLVKGRKTHQHTSGTKKTQKYSEQNQNPQQVHDESKKGTKNQQEKERKGFSCLGWRVSSEPSDSPSCWCFLAKDISPSFCRWNLCMHRRTRSSQPGFMDARSRLVSRDVILPGQVKHLMLTEYCSVLDLNPTSGLEFQASSQQEIHCVKYFWEPTIEYLSNGMWPTPLYIGTALITWRISSRASSSCPTLKVLPRGEALVRGHHRSLFDRDSSRHTDETWLEICKFAKVWVKMIVHQLMQRDRACILQQQCDFSCELSLVVLFRLHNRYKLHSALIKVSVCLINHAVCLSVCIFTEIM